MKRYYLTLELYNNKELKAAYTAKYTCLKNK